MNIVLRTSLPMSTFGEGEQASWAVIVIASRPKIKDA